MRESAFRSRAQLGVAIALSSLLASCQIVGPTAIDNGRDRYNSVIQTTSMEQTLANLVREYHHEQTIFMDVTEVDAAQSIGASAAGGSTGIGARRGTTGGTIAGQVGSAQGSIQYSESPTIRYQPLLGQSLVAQLVTPISIDALADLYSSQSRIAPVLGLAIPHDLTPNSWTYEPALAALRELRLDNAIRFSAGRSQLTEAKVPAPAEGAASSVKNSITINLQCGASPCANNSGSSGAASGKKDDTLFVYLLPFSYLDPHLLRDLKLWIRLLRIYDGTQPKFVARTGAACVGPFNFALPEGDRSPIRNRTHDRRKIADRGAKSGQLLNPDALKDWEDSMKTNAIRSGLASADLSSIDPKKTETIYDCLPEFIELRAVPADTQEANYLRSSAPVISTSSAEGLLRAAVARPSPKVEFVTSALYDEIRRHRWNQSGEVGELTDQDGLDFYTLLPSEEDSVDCGTRKMTFGCDNAVEFNHAADPKGANCDSKAPAGRIKSPRCIEETLTPWILYGSKTLHGADTSPPAYYPGGIFIYEQPNTDFLDPDIWNINLRLGSLWRYMLIIRDKSLPDLPAYAAYYDKDGYWYYIAGDDYISQRNFQLVTLFMTMMAVPSAVPPLSPTINVGG